MTDDEIERLAAAIAAELRRATGAREEPWVRAPIRPEPPGPPGAPPPWSGAAQRLGDVAPVRDASPSTHRADPGEAAAAIRAAAAGQGNLVRTRGRGSAVPASPHRSVVPGAITVRIGVSNRHVHLSEADARTLFGASGLVAERQLSQPGQFAARDRLSVVGPSGTIDGMRVVGPARGETQVELSFADAARLGVDPRVAGSGALQGSVGGVELVGPAGRVRLSRGVIVAARHLHLSPDDARAWHLVDGDLISVRCGQGARAVVFEGVLVRAGTTHATELHLDVDEARAAGVSSGDAANVVGRRRPARAPRPLVTERDVLAAARRGEPLPAGALLTPSARDRAVQLGLLP